ncbi:MAG: hypothetical protein QOG64_1011, partial [Acidimicrobiaceae bacterium]|nr:hypothetical protein [Acidimicrobiaceae bacterium]
LAGAAMGIFAWPTLWVYLVAQVIAGAAAGPAAPGPAAPGGAIRRAAMTMVLDDDR